MTAPEKLCDHAIGVFDSGVGGLSVLRALWKHLPRENFVYVADSGHAPYGEKDDRVVLERSQAITAQLRLGQGIKALVVACNTATAAAIAELRSRYPDMPIIGIEPAVKPALAQSKTGIVGVMATRGTLKSEKFSRLLQTVAGSASLRLQACDGLADAIERNDAMNIEALCAQYTGGIGPFGTNTGQCDTLVLGCTHYPFADAVLRRLCGSGVVFLEGGEPVARRTRHLLESSQLLTVRDNTGSTHFMTTGNFQALSQAVERWLGSRLVTDASTPNQTVSSTAG